MAMRIVFPRKGEVSLQPFELPAVGAHDVKVRTDFSLMSVGTETIILHQRYAPDTHFARMFSFPQLKTGVQAVGRVTEVGASVAEIAAGDRIFMRMAHGSHQVLPASACSLVPDQVDARQACWCGLAKTAFRAAWAGKFDHVDNILFIGAGPVGQMAIRWASAVGVKSIVALDTSAYRLQHASTGGATATIHGDIADADLDLSAAFNGNGPALIVDSTGNASVLAHALRVAPKFGKVILLGDTGFPSEQSLTSDVMSKGLTIQAVHDSHDRDGWNQRKIDARFFACVEEGTFDLSGLITHVYSPLQCDDAYALADNQRDSVMGILYDWQDLD